tara:strand:- start:289 stop:774 length:486 start_codon:yes stop_codon:yes gene_type:complete
MSARDFSSIGKLPTSPAVYALCAEDRANDFIAYVGISSNLRNRVYQHLVMRDSSAVVESSPVKVNVDSVSSLRWWVHEEFNTRDRLEGAELIAFEILEPTMRSRGRINTSGLKFSKNKKFREMMIKLFESDQAGTLNFPGIRDLTRRIAELEKRVEDLESR